MASMDCIGQKDTNNKKFIDVFKNIFNGISVKSMEPLSLRLPPERQLESINTSRAEVNYQIRRLRDSGLIDSRRGNGNYLVKDTERATTTSIRTLLEQLVYLGYLTSTDINETRKMLEFLIYEYWIFRKYDEQLLVISELQLRISQMQQYHAEYVLCKDTEKKETWKNKIIKMDIEFHKILGNITGTSLLSIFISAMSELQHNEIERFWMNSSLEKQDVLIKDHEDILESLRTMSTLIQKNERIIHVFGTLEKMEISNEYNENDLEAIKAFEKAKNDYRLAVASHYVDAKS